MLDAARLPATGPRYGQLASWGLWGSCCPCCWCEAQRAALPGARARSGGKQLQPLHQTPLHEAVEAGDADMATTLLDAGADPSCTDFDGKTPLHSALEMQARRGRGSLDGCGCPAFRPAGTSCCLAAAAAAWLCQVFGCFLRLG